MDFTFVCTAASIEISKPGEPRKVTETLYSSYSSLYGDSFDDFLKELLDAKEQCPEQYKDKLKIDIEAEDYSLSMKSLLHKTRNTGGSVSEVGQCKKMGRGKP